MGAPTQGQPQQPITTQILPLGGTPSNFFPRAGPKLSYRGEPLEKFGSPGRMDTNQGQAHLRRGNPSNPSSHDIPPRGGPLDFFFQGRGTNCPIGRNPWNNFGLPGRMDTYQGRSNLRKVNHINPSPRNTSPRGVPLAIFFQGRGTNYPIGGEPLANFLAAGGRKT